MFNQAFAIAAELLYAGLLTAFFRPFLPRGRRAGKLLLLFSAYLVLELVCNHTALPQGASGLLLTGMLLAVSKALNLERPWVLLLTLLYFNARISSGLMVESLYFVLERSLPLPVEPLEAVFLRAAALVTLFLLSHAALFAAMLYALRRQLQKRRLSLHRRELCYLALVPTAGVLFGQVISRLLIEFKDGVLLQLYERHPAFLAVVPVLALLFCGGAYLTIVFQQGMAALLEEQAALCAAYQQAQAIRSRIREAEQFYARVREMKHEMRGHLTNIQGLVRSGEYACLEAAGKRMRGNDIVIAPNIFEEMVSDPQKAACYEQKISYFFTDVIPKGTAWAASVGLTFEPCGVVIHEDGTVTYICGGGDSPERVAEVNRINREKAEKQAEQQRLYLEQTAAALERATFNIRDLRFVRKG